MRWLQALLGTHVLEIQIRYTLTRIDVHHSCNTNTYLSTCSAFRSRRYQWDESQPIRRQLVFSKGFYFYSTPYCKVK